ncbi:Alpha/Beta hydrolase protein [Rhypophila decipiens]|uniref:Carboxylic ester hydrolase n=1 Tax=Rhypophila decipiens TaxID=261697 RepID=A0AAN7B8G6_9PEZI|nr:Alpha/Beta hydrolase protein [Rhypophila decipiens]
MKFQTLLLSSCLSLASSQATVTPRNPTVKLKDAAYEGTTTKITISPSSTGAATAVTVNKFLGIRFGSPPPKRFLAARLPSPSPRNDSTSFIRATTQPFSCTEREDCLFLNLFAPAPAPNNSSTKKKDEKKPVPVMIWWHGGALQSGSISGTDGSILAANENVIVIAAQYRLGVFGFPGKVPGIPPTELNAGFGDQKLVLEWVKDNINLFGGDPDRVTIFGESAGAVSVDAKLLSQPFEKEKSLFQGAIMQSGGLHTFTRVALGIGRDVTGLGTGNREDEMPFFTLARALNCELEGEKVLPCVQAKTFDEVKSAVSRVNLLFPPVDDDGLSSVGDSDSARRAGRTVDVPVLVGSTFDEGNIFPTAGIASKGFDQWVDVIYPGSNDTTNREAVKRAYAPGTSWQIQTEADAKHMLHSDFHFACTTTYDANLIAALGTNPIWRYVFNASLPGGRLAGHGSDVAFVFGPSSQAASKANQELSRKMMAAWGAFARDPASGPGWVPYGSVKESLANIGGEGGRDGITLVDPVVVDGRCPVFDDAYDPDRPRS